MLENERSLDDLMLRVQQIHKISKDIDDGVQEDLALLGEITRGTTEVSRRMRILRGGVEAIKRTARTVRKYHLFLIVSVALVCVLYMLFARHT